ncbi:lectin-like domain-containing protein [Levilactobacillus humaensis]|uniref:lectin-like domain-containing protein n=1 Tax=Levilactobacillus humaensis TaxID=2950375 RepID=UPI0021C32228|nr:hypothetical protein [Levilactobacillus humaensis]
MYRLVLLLLACSLGVMARDSAHAAMTRDDDMLAAIASAPPGFSLDRGFSPGRSFGAADRLLDGPAIPKQIAQLTNDNFNQMYRQVGVLWSKTPGTQNVPRRIPLTHDQRWSFWLYFGNKGDQAADGMTFTLQNAADGTDAIAMSGSGQSLGVWGGDTNASGDTTYMSQIALQKSWTLEFDTHVNNVVNSVSQANYFDYESVPSQGPHIASNYPAEKSTYQIFGSWGHYYFGLKHLQPKRMTNPSNGRWHHVTMDWHKDKSQMTYAFNDRDPHTGQAITPEVQDTVPIDLTKLGTTSRPATSAVWGLTGATSARGENNLAVVDQEPGQMRFDVEQETQVVTKDGQYQTIHEGDKIPGDADVRYHFQAAGQPDGFRASNTTAVVLGTSPVLKLLAGSVRQSGQVTSLYDFNAAELAAPPMSHAIGQDVFTKDQPSLETELHAKGQSPEEDTYVAPQTAIYYGENHYVAVKSVGYYLKRKLNLQLEKLGTPTAAVAPQVDAEIEGRLSNNGRTIQPDAMKDSKLTFSVNGKAYTFTQLAGAWTGTDGHFKLRVPAAALKQGKNALTISATNRDDVAPDLTIPIIQLSGDLVFSAVSPETGFSGHLTGKQQLITRDDEWQLRVRDERAGENRWKLQASLAAPLRDEQGRPLQGDMIYQAEHEQKVIGTDPVVIYEQQTHGLGEETDVIRDWHKNTGMLIRVNGGATAGQYEGELRWQLADAP